MKPASAEVNSTETRRAELRSSRFKARTQKNVDSQYCTIDKVQNGCTVAGELQGAAFVSKVECDSRQNLRLLRVLKSDKLPRLLFSPRKNAKCEQIKKVVKSEFS